MPKSYKKRSSYCSKNAIFTKKGVKNQIFVKTDHARSMSAQCQYEKWYCFLFYPLGTQKSSSTIQAAAKLNKPFAEIALIDSTFFASTGHDLVNFNKKYQLAPFLTLKGFKTTEICNKIWILEPQTQRLRS